jgi:fucose permease
VTETDQVATRVVSARTGTFVVFGVNGFLIATWMSRVPDVRDLLNLTPGQLGLVLLAVSAGAVVGLPMAGLIARRIGAANTVRLGMALAMPGAALAALAVQAQTSMFLVMPWLFFLGLGSGIWDVAQNLEGTMVEQGLRKAIMPWFHAAFSGGTVAAALVGAAMTALQVPVAGHMAVTAVLGTVAVLWAAGQFITVGGDPSDPHAHQSTTRGIRSAWTEPRTLLIGLMVLAAAFTEGTANDWMAVAFVDGHDVDKALGVIALAIFLTFMTAGRILGTGLLDRYGRGPVLRILFAASIVGCLLVVFGNTWLAFVGAAVWGVGASLGFPVGMSAAADEPQHAAMRLSVVTTIGYTAFLAGPPLLGFLGDYVGILNSLLVVGAVSVLAFFVVPAANPLPAADSER